MMNFYPFFNYILHKYIFKSSYKNLMRFRPFCALIKCIIISDSKVHALLMNTIEEGLHYCSNRHTENNIRFIYI